jgi:hypothetical protein
LLFARCLDESRLPGVLLERFSRSAAERLVALLGILCPISGGARVHLANDRSISSPQKTRVEVLRPII